MQFGEASVVRSVFTLSPLADHSRNLVSWLPLGLVGIRHSFTIHGSVDCLRQNGQNGRGFWDLLALGHLQCECVCR